VLGKRICKQCRLWPKAASFEVAWKRGLVLYCIVLCSCMVNSLTVRDYWNMGSGWENDLTKRSPPSGCPFQLEHLVEMQNEQSQIRECSNL